MTAEQKAELSSLARIARIGWDMPVLAGTPAWFQAFTARPHLPRHVPDADIIIHIDADAWVADRRAIDLLRSAASGGAMAIVPDPPYRESRALLKFARESYVISFGPSAAVLANLRNLNCGVFALKRQSPHWQAWASVIAEALQRPGTS